MSEKSMKRVIANTKPDEPVFILCARDVTAPGIVREWANQAMARGAADSKVTEALTIADDMQDWQEANPTLVKVPD